MRCAVVGSTLPNFILGILLIFIFSLKLRILPSGGIGTPQHFLMPVIALSVGPIANVARLTRSSLLDVIGQEHLDCARAKGMREWKVVLKHGLRNALIPVITILGAQLSAMIGGSVVVETVFAWPGIGTLIVSSAQQRDFPVVVFGVLVISASVTFVNLLFGSQTNPKIGYMLRSDSYKLLVYGSMQDCAFYDLKKDPFELCDVSKEPDYQETLHRYQTALSDFVLFHALGKVHLDTKAPQQRDQEVLNRQAEELKAFIRSQW